MSGGEEANDHFLLARTFRIKGWVQTGDRTFEQITPEVVNLDLRKSRGTYPEVWLRICNDNAQVRMINTKTGKPVWPPNKGDEAKYVTYAKLLSSNHTWRVFHEEERDENEKC